MYENQVSKESLGKECIKEEALALDASDSLSHLRSEFIIPSKDDLKRKTLSVKDGSTEQQDQPCIYLCGNSLGLQPRRTADTVATHLRAWATKGVFGHFKAHEDSELPPFVDIDEVAAERMAPIVGASATEVAIMETLSANLHLMMASFFQPTKEKYKIILEGKAFPSDHELLHRNRSGAAANGNNEVYWVITPAGPRERGAQLSIRLKPGLLEGVMAELEEQGVVVDERKPDVIRVAPAPLYNTFSEVWMFVAIFQKACSKAYEGQAQQSNGSTAFAGIEDKGWAQIK
ncbi:MAG: hypothetical protein Q9166_005473 [cf. Caloplaca sp. 2 TL-2023]